MYYTNLPTMPYAQARIRFDHSGMSLISYRTEVLRVTHDGWLTVYGLYSATTRKHISAFMRSMVGAPLNNYQVAKAAYEGNYRINTYTGEIQELGK
jgi:hypothetical protein